MAGCRQLVRGQFRFSSWFTYFKEGDNCLCAYLDRARAPFVLLQFETIQAVCFPPGLILLRNNVSIASSNGISFPLA